MTHIFYEAPHRIAGTLEDIIATFGPTHPIALARELTKLHEEFLRGTAAEVLESLTRRDSIRGEMVLMIDGNIRTETAAAQPLAAEVEALIQSGLSEKDALKQAAKSRGLGKSEAYREWQRAKR